MSFFERIFSSRYYPSGKSSRSLDQELKELERKAESAPLGAGWIFLNRAGDLCLRSGDRTKALKYFGQAIDALLEDGQPEPARGLAKKIIRVHPEAIRTLCTLTWLDLAARHPAAALQSLREYVKAAKRGKREDLAADQAVAMARVTDDIEFLGGVVEALSDMGFSMASDGVKKWVAEGGSPEAGGDPEVLARYCLLAAVGSNVQRRAEGAVA